MCKLCAALVVCVGLALPLNVFAEDNPPLPSESPIFEYSCSVTHGAFTQARTGVIQADSLRFGNFAGNASGKFSNGMGYILSVGGELSTFVTADTSITSSDRVLSSATVGGISGDIGKEHTLTSSTWLKGKLLSGGCILHRRS